MKALEKEIISLNNSLLAIDGNVLSVTPPPPEDVQIGNQIWKTKNLAIDDGLGGIYTQTVDYGEGPVVEYYYRWDAAVRVASKVLGWHLPTEEEWKTLMNTAGGNWTADDVLKSTYGWTELNGRDEYGFSVFPAGNQLYGQFYNFGKNACYWTATHYGSNTAESYRFSRNQMTQEAAGVDLGYSVRLVKD